MTTPPTPTKRILSIDALRGFVMLWLTGLGTFLASFQQVADNAFTRGMAEQMRHIDWEGLHLWDLVMPLFLFITGCSLVFSLEKRLQRERKITVYRHVVIRVAILWLLGMVVQGNLLSLKWGRFLFFSNTLQAIGIGYLGSSLILLLRDWRAQAGITAGLVALYWVLLHFVPVPGGSAGVLTPDANFAAYIDRAVLGTHDDGPHYTWVLSSLTFTVTVMLGCFCGKILKIVNWQPRRKALTLLGLATAVLATGYLLALHDPCIKPIWSPSFTLISGGYCILALAFFFFVIDVLGFQTWSYPLVHIGSNALFVYLFFGMFFNARQFATQFVYGLEDVVGSYYPVLTSGCAMLVVWGLCYLMYRKRIFIKI